MIVNVLRFFFFALLLSSCVTSQQQTSKNEIENKPMAKAESKAKPTFMPKGKAQASVPLDKMDDQFLYLASHQAIDKNQPELAIRFLKTLVQKSAQDIIPRFELVDLLLSSGHRPLAVEAKTYMETIPETDKESFGEADLSEYQLLYARVLIANGDSENASVLLSALLDKTPERVEVRLLLARMYAIEQKYVLAHDTLEQGLLVNKVRKEHKDIRLQKMKVQLYLQQGNFSAADKVLSVIQQEHPEFEDVVLQRAHLAEQQKQFVKAESLLQMFIDLHPKTAVLSNNMLAAMYVRQRRIDAAIMVYERMLPITASDAGVLVSLGKLYYEQRKFTQAREYFSQAVERLTSEKTGDNDLGSATFYYGASLEANHEWEKARLQYQKVLPEQDMYLDAQIRLANIDMGQKDYKSAEKRLFKLKVAAPENANVYEVLSSLRLQQEKYKEVISESNNLDASVRSIPLLFNRAVAFEKLKDFVALDATLEKILEIQPDYAEALNFYGYSLADRGIRLLEAQKMIEKALEIKPNDAYYLDSLAWVFYKQKEYKKALAMQLDAIAVIQSDPVMMEHLGDIYWRDNKIEPARQAWLKAIELKHEDPAKVKSKIERGLM